MVPHAIYTREGNNLTYIVEMALLDALHACSFAVPALDGRIISVAADTVINPKTEIRVPGEGMPVLNTDGPSTTKGDLFVRFRILFPRILDEEKKRQITAVLT